MKFLKSFKAAAFAALAALLVSSTLSYGVFYATADKIIGTGTAPALTSCGTSPAITGTDLAGTVTMGTGTPTGCVITFNVPYAAAPHCVVTWIATPLASQSYVTSATAITLTQTATSSNVAKYFCVAQAGG